MAKYIWTNKDFKRCLRSLYEAKSSENNPELLKLIDVDIALLKESSNFDFDIHNPQNDYLKMYRIGKKYLYQFFYLWPDLEKFYNISNGIFIYPNKQLSLINFTKDDLTTLTHDFYKSLGGNLYHTFMKHFKEKDNHLSFQKFKVSNNPRALTIPLMYLDEYFIKIYQSKTINDLLDIVHEYGHVIAISNNYKYNIDNYWSEIIPVLMEFLILDFYYNLTKDNNIYLYAMGTHNIVVDQSCSIVDLIDIMNTEKEKFKNEFELRKTVKELGISEENLDLCIKDINNETYYYLPAYMMALELYKSYQNDPDKTLYIINKMLKFDLVNLKEDHERLVSLGINANASLKEYEEGLKQKELTLRR